MENMSNKYAYSEPKSEIIEITPEIAKDMLTHNVKNRTVSRSIVDMYVTDLKLGHWKLSNDAITFDTNGNLANGQHRLNAIINANAVVKALVLYGTDEDCMLVMDKQRRRTYVGTRQIIVGMPEYQRNAATVSAVRLLIFSVVQGHTSKWVTEGELDEFFSTYPNISKTIYCMTHTWKKTRSAGVCVAIMHAMANNAKGIEEFLRVSENDVDGLDYTKRNIKAALNFWNADRHGCGFATQLKTLAAAKESMYLFFENRIRRNKKDDEIYPTTELMLMALEKKLEMNEGETMTAEAGR